MCDTAPPARKPSPSSKAGLQISADFGVRRDKVDRDGKLTFRHASRLHHIGIGRAWAGTRVLIFARDLEIRIITEHGELVREFTLNPERNYQAQAPKV